MQWRHVRICVWVWQGRCRSLCPLSQSEGMPSGQSVPDVTSAHAFLDVPADLLSNGGIAGDFKLWNDGWSHHSVLEVQHVSDTCPSVLAAGLKNCLGSPLLLRAEVLPSSHFKAQAQVEVEVKQSLAVFSAEVGFSIHLHLLDRHLVLLPWRHTYHSLACRRVLHGHKQELWQCFLGPVQEILVMPLLTHEGKLNSRQGKSVYTS
mmetsp:Transcript_23443/g.54620  ORF Transcript_23443/g.54620 Transcript_23443/m.54620 type:complete len:205 (+) Transcript_23443:2077-2691(+)